MPGGDGCGAGAGAGAGGAGGRRHLESWRLSVLTRLRACLRALAPFARLSLPFAFVSFFWIGLHFFGSAAAPAVASRTGLA